MKFSFKTFILGILLASCTVQQASAGWLPAWVPSTFQSVKNFADDHKGIILGVAALTVVGTGFGYLLYKKFGQPLLVIPPAKAGTPEPLLMPNGATPQVRPSIVEVRVGDNEEPIVAEPSPQNLPPIPHDKNEQDTPDDQEPQSRPKNPSPTPKDKKQQSGDIEDVQPVEKQEVPFAWAFPTFNEWNNHCKKLKEYAAPDKKLVEKRKKRKIERKNKQIAVTLEELHKALNQYFMMLNENEFFKNSYCWVNQDIPEKLFASIQAEDNKAVFDPFVQKLVINPGCVVAFHGDIHGDMHSLNAFIAKLAEKGYLDPQDPFKISNPDFYMIFLGDYTDRGWYGAEVIYTVLRLKCANPDRVFMVRGNHEDRSLNEKEKVGGLNGFFTQLTYKYGMQKDDLLYEKIGKLYETLPLALYFGSHGIEETNYLLCCHGGIEIGFNPHVLLQHESPIAFTKLGMLDRNRGLATLLSTPDLFDLFKQANYLITSPEDLGHNFLINLRGSRLAEYPPTGIMTKLIDDGRALLTKIGFQWNDYEVNPACEIECFVKEAEGRGWMIGKTFNHAVLKMQSTPQHKIHGVFRAHQHSMGLPLNPMMKRIFNEDGLDYNRNAGVGKLWIHKAREQLAYSLWDNIVCTFNVSPHTPYRKLGYNYDTYGLLTTTNNFNTWHLEVCRIKMFEQEIHPVAPVPAKIEAPRNEAVGPVDKAEVRAAALLHQVAKQELEKEVEHNGDAIDEIIDEFENLESPDTFTIGDMEFIVLRK